MINTLLIWSHTPIVFLHSYNLFFDISFIFIQVVQLYFIWIVNLLYLTLLSSQIEWQNMLLEQVSIIIHFEASLTELGNLTL